MPDVYNVTWKHVESRVRIIADQIMMDIPEQTPKFIGVERGGVIPVMMLTQLCNSKFESIRLDFGAYGDLMVPSDLDKFYGNDTVIVIDDISDTGHTLDKISKYIARNTNLRIKTATLYMRFTSDFVPDYLGSKFNDDRWLHFPWEPG